MTSYVQDCASLINKISNKEKGFWFPITATDDMRKDVFLNIAMSYYECN
jgi:hypothetical protein